ncbi:MAG: hypothetical protein ACKV19_17685 [Verrucomicrobiales bacterium]
MTGASAVFRLSINALFLAEVVAELWHDARHLSASPIREFLDGPPSGLMSWLLNLAPPPPFGPVHSLLLTGLYWFLSCDRPPPLHHVIWHGIACSAALFVLALTLVLGRHLSLDGSSPVTMGRRAIHILLSAALLVALVRVIRRGPDN